MEKPIALVDLDGVLCNFEETLLNDLNLLKSPDEPPINLWDKANRPQHIKERIDLICSSKEWWANLPWLQSGKDILNVLLTLNFRIVILTQGSKNNPASWSGKMQWCLKNLPTHVDIDLTITRDKSLVYGKVLVDDYPNYIDSWLKHRPKGIVIMPTHHYNINYNRLQVFPYNGTSESLSTIKDVLRYQRNNKGEQ